MKVYYDAIVELNNIYTVHNATIYMYTAIVLVLVHAIFNYSVQ